MSASHPQFFPNANGSVFNNVSIQNIQGNYYNGDPDLTELNTMAYAINAGCNATKECLADTRIEILDELENWGLGKKPEVPRMIWLNGSAGTGKSCIAHTIALRLYRTGNLGSFFAFDNSYLSERRHEKVFSTIARDLAGRNAAFKKALADTLRTNNWLRSTDIIQQWDNLVVKPAVHLKNDGPILIVIEALDESGDSDSRTHLLSILANRLEALPPNLRILLTSRPLDDIINGLKGSPSILCIYMNDIPRSATEYDIYLYISAQLARVGGSLLDTNQILELVNRAEGLFQWAFVACNFIKGTGKISNPKKQYDMLISSPSSAGLKTLDGLYETVLQSVIDEGGIDLFRSVMGQVLGVFEPLSINALIELRDHFSPSDNVNDGDDINLVLKHMGSLLSGISDPFTPIRPLHSSFVDYLTDKGRSKHFYVDSSIHSSDLALASLRVMKTGLRFNICQLKTSYLLNSEVQNLQDLIHKYISPGLSYACRYWARHLDDMTFDLHISDVRYVLYNKFLYWVEVLSLLGCVTLASHALSLLIKWAYNRSEGEDILGFSSDAQRFICMFGGVIAQSTPHLYLSALPFAPENSIVRRKYADLFPGALRVASGLMSDWPACQNVLHRHRLPIRCAVFSPDDALIVSGSLDGVAHIWDAETGEIAFAPLIAHTKCMRSVSFSPDGRLCASASDDRKILIWNARTWRLIGEPLVHSDKVTCVTFHVDGKHVISGSFDKIIYVWDVETRKEVCDALTGHRKRITCVAISPDGTHFVSGSADHTIRTWKTGPYEDAGISFEGHHGSVSCVTYSYDGQRIISGSADNTIRIWDTETGATIIGPICGHSDVVLSIALSQDDTRIVSGSSDKTMCLWDAHTGQMIAEPITGHTGGIYAVAFSRDGHRVISGAGDNTIRIWDMRIASKTISKRVEKHKGWITNVVISPDGRRIVSAAEEHDTPIRIWDMVQQADRRMSPEAFKGHSGFVNDVAFSPDGKYIVSCSDDMTIRVWNAETGDDLFGPLVGHTGWVSSVKFSYDGKYIFSSSEEDDTLRVWDAQNGNAVGSPLSSCGGRCIAASPNSYHVAAMCKNAREICIFQVDALKQQIVELRPRICAHRTRISCMTFSPDGKHIISGSPDQIIIVWDVQTATIVNELYFNTESGRSYDPHCLAVPPNGKFIIASLNYGSICLWDAEHGNVAIGPLIGHTARVTSTTISLDGKYFVSAYADHTIRVQEIQVGAYQFVKMPRHGHIVPNVQSQSASSCIVQFSTKTGHALKHVDMLFSQDYGFTATDWTNVFEIAGITGWIIGPERRRLLWIPHDHLTSLITHLTRMIFNAEVTELDLSHFAHGPLWDTCFRDLEA